MHGTIPSLPNTPSWRGAQLKYRGRTLWMGDQPIGRPLPSFQQFLVGAAARFDSPSSLLSKCSRRRTP